MYLRVNSLVGQPRQNNSTMDLSRRQLSDADMETVVVKSLLRNECKNLVLKENNITEEGAAKLAEGLKKNTSLKKLDLGYNSIGDRGVKHLVDALVKSNRTLIKLHLQGNGITEVGAGYLADMLRSNPKIERLGLDYNRIGDRGIELLSDALRSSSVGGALDRNNKACASEVLNKGSPLTALYLDGNNITDHGVSKLAEMLEFNRTLNSLALGKNNITDLGVQILIEAIIKKRDGMINLNIFSNERITDNSVEIFRKLFRHHRTFKLYKLYDCGFSRVGESKLRTAAECIRGFELLLVGDGFDYRRGNLPRPMQRQPSTKEKSWDDWCIRRRESNNNRRSIQVLSDDRGSGNKEKSVTDVKSDQPKHHHETTAPPIALSRGDADSDDPALQCAADIERLTISNASSAAPSLSNTASSIAPSTKSNDEIKDDGKGVG